VGEDEGPVRRLGLGRHTDLAPVEPGPIRHPVRLATAFGAALLVVGVVLPWVEFSVDSVGDSVNGIRGETWGIVALGVAAAMVGALATRLIAESSSRAIQLLPAGIGIAGLLVYLNIAIESDQLAAAYRANGYRVSLGPGLAALLAGSIVCAVGGVASSALTWRKFRPNPAARSTFAASGEWYGCADFAAELAVGALAGIACAAAGAIVAVAVTADSAATPELVVVLVIGGALVGGIATDRLWRRFRRPGHTGRR
jgi:hypothetical protein